MVDTAECITARLVTAFDATWATIRERHPEVPEVVLTIGSGTLGSKPGQTKLGHFAAGRWQVGENDPIPELFVSGEGLRRTAEEVLGTLLHEAAHGLAHVRDIKDTSRQGRYHNKRFKALGEELGLILEEDPAIGWSRTTVPTKTSNQYRREVDLIKAALVAHRHDEVAKPTKARSNNLAVATCGCERKIRVAKTTLVDAPILCGRCGIEFTAEDDDE
ncbi:hypothetical protein BS329_32860 [Amycolatopsis coloradensis]|uniref:SprT-like domain-containing protein n=1 Tax=Amycolatopsis coloradensis TaxID=76021 RepID=A0A1R0KHK5_9PSEU|nr:hypothetical protein BS329_32860 [Amycolatopsis coloradensis]